MSYLSGRIAGALSGLPVGVLSGYGARPTYPGFSGINDPNLARIWALRNALTNPAGATGADWFVPAAQPSLQRDVVPKVDPADRGALDAAIIGFGQGSTFGFANNLSSTLDATFAPIVNSLLPQGSQRFTEPDWLSRYNDAMAVGRQIEKTAERFHPIAHGVGEVAGGVATAPLAPQATVFKGVQAAADAERWAKVGAMASRVAAGAGNAAVTGGAYGGLYGFGSTDGDLWDRLVSAGKNALWGSGLGAAVGAPLHAVAELLAPRLATRTALPAADITGTVGDLGEPASPTPRSETGVAQQAEPTEPADPLLSPESGEASRQVPENTGAPAESILGSSLAVPVGPSIITPAAPAIIQLRRSNFWMPDIRKPFDVSDAKLAAIPSWPQRALTRLRYPSPSGMSPSMERLLSSDKPYQGFVDAVQQGKDLGGANATDSLRIRAALRDLYGPEAGDEAFRRTMGAFAAGSPGTNAMQNARIGSFLSSRISRGLPMLGNEQLPWPFGHPRNWLHNRLAENVIWDDWNSERQPKTSSLNENFLGNDEPAAIDRIILDGLATDYGDRDFLRRLDRRDYWALEELAARAGKPVNLAPGPTAQAARFGYACRSGSCGPDWILPSIVKRFPKTAEELWLPEDEVPSLFLRGKIPTYGIGAGAIAAGALGSGQRALPPGDAPHSSN